MSHWPPAFDAMFHRCALLLLLANALLHVTDGCLGTSAHVPTAAPIVRAPPIVPATVARTTSTRFRTTTTQTTTLSRSSVLSHKMSIIANSAIEPSLSTPVDVKLHPSDGTQLWIANQGKSQLLLLREPGTPQMISQIWQDRAEYHYTARVTALSFDKNGSTLVTCQNSKNDYHGMLQPNFFMGPTIYEMYPVGSLYGRPEAAGGSVASITPDGEKCEKPGFPDCFLIHSDMLHEGPMCSGTVHDPGAVTEGGLHVGSTRSGHVQFYTDGVHGELMRFDASSLHGPGTLDHRTANIRRYIDVKLKQVDGIPGHMVLDDDTRILYIADPGNGRVLRVDADGGEFRRVAQCVPDECYPAHESYQEGSCGNGYCTGGRCLDADGYGCYHIFTETADVFEYELWGCSTQDDFVKTLALPSGLTLGNGQLYVGDYSTGIIHVFDLDGVELAHLPVSQPGLAGLEFKCVNTTTCIIYFANALTNEIGMVSITNQKSDVASKGLPRRSCNTKGNFTRPPFNVTHGAGYQNAMVIKYSYGKHCEGFQPGDDVEKKGKSFSEVLKCPDRTDCSSVNGDAILMAGYLCHPCIPNPCAYKAQTCLDLLPYRCKSGFQCVNGQADLANAQKQFFCTSPTSPVHPSSKPSVIADETNTPSLLSPFDVKFHPKAAPDLQLWVANRGRSQMLVMRNPGTSQMSTQVWQDRAEYHYNAQVSALSFDSETGKTMMTCQHSRNDYFGMRAPNFFMGPTLYEIYPVGEFYGRPGNPVASVSPDGKRCEKPGFPDCFLIHSDMLHESPQCMGTVHDPGAVTKDGLHTGTTVSGHVYFYSDGNRGELMRFDADTLHGPGTLDHRTANIRRYIDVKLMPVDNVPGHMVLDNATRILYVADPGNGRVLRVDADGGKFKRVAQCVPDECYPAHESYKEGTCANTYCTGGRCTDADGYGCYHVFTETADTFEYELWGCSAQDDFVRNVVMPSGLALGNGHLYVGDYSSGRIHIYDLNGTEVGHMQVSRTGLAGLEFRCVNSTTCNLYFANALTNEVGVVSVANQKSNVPPKPLPLVSCDAEGNHTRPPFNVTHGAGYQNAMVIKHSYGKHCDGFEPGEDVEAKGKHQLDVFNCPDRTDCSSVNGDAILMAGYLCHPCIPNPCKYILRSCLDLYKYSCTSGFECPNDLAKARQRPLCGMTTTAKTTPPPTTTTASTKKSSPNFEAQSSHAHGSSSDAAGKHVLVMFLGFVLQVAPYKS